MKTLLTILLFTGLTGFSQNEWHTQLTMLDSKHVQITNLQNVPTFFHVTGAVTKTTRIVEPLGSDTLALNECGEVNVFPDNMQTCIVSLNSCNYVLAIMKPLYFYPQVKNNELSVEFKLPNPPEATDKFQVRYTLENGQVITKDIPATSRKGNYYFYNFKYW